MFATNLDTPLVYLKGVGPKRAELLQKELGISTYEQLLNHYPFRYIDRTRFYKINELNPEMPLVQVVGKIVRRVKVRGLGGGVLGRTLSNQPGPARPRPQPVQGNTGHFMSTNIPAGGRPSRLRALRAQRRDKRLAPQGARFDNRPHPRGAP